MIWCLGMYSSGSTWLYNAVRAVALEVGTPRRAGFAANFRALAALLADDNAAIVKTHELDAKGAKLAARQAAAILVTIRDPRDAVASMIKNMQLTAKAALELVHHSALQVREFSGDERARVFRYEDGFIDDPAIFDALAAMLGAQLGKPARQKLFADSRRDVIDAAIARMVASADKRVADVVDPVSQWHGHHANRTGEVGRWVRALTPETLALVETRLGGWMVENGYQLSNTQAATRTM
jgi:hypothetical protein